MKNGGNGYSILRLYFGVTGVLEKTVEWLTAILFFFILSVTLLQVFFRFVLNAPLVWSEEMARYLGIFMILLATSNALKKNALIGVDVLSSKMPQSFQKPLRIFACTASMSVMGFLAFHAFTLTSKNFFTPTPAMRIPIGIPYSCMTLSCFICALVGLCLTIETIFNIQRPEIAVKEKGQ